VVIAAKCLELSLPAIPSSVRVARAAVTEAVAPFASDELTDDVRLCVSEAVTNAVRHAYGPDDTGGEVEILVVRLEDELRVVVRDHGRGIDEPPAGRGFGLQIVARVAARHTLHGGEEGTTVSMSFDLGRDETG
jgi:anti-sigma regulatory factor (Ser/Thr protein kinase)